MKPKVAAGAGLNFFKNSSSPANRFPMSSISSVSSSAALMYQMQQAAAAKQGATPNSPTPTQQVQAAANDADRDGDTDAAGRIDTKA
jgi:hypothetical protein